MALSPNRPRTILQFLPLEDRTTPTASLANSILVGIDPSRAATVLAQLTSTGLAAKVEPIGFDVYRVTTPAGTATQRAIAMFEGAGVKYAEPDVLVKKLVSPNDPAVVDGTAWQFNNTGQSGGKAGADISAFAGWEEGIGTGDTIIAVIDDGVEYTHPDLAANMWTNPGEIAGNNLDDDANGFIDDIHGFNFVTNTGEMLPDAASDHGTHVAGIVGAVGDNGIGTSGAIWKTRMMTVPLFYHTGTGSGSLGVAIQAIGYAVANGAKVLNNSWGYQGALSEALQAAIEGARDKGVIFVAAAGNSSLDNDTNDFFPTNYYGIVDNVVSVGASDRNELMADFSNFGRTKVAVAAPGVEIFSTVTGGGYGLKQGTSMASPLVAGMITAYWDRNPDLTYQEVIENLLATVDRGPTYDDRVATDGRVNFDELMGTSKSAEYFATGAGQTGSSIVNVYRSAGRLVHSFDAFPGFNGGVRVATGDVNGDGLADVIAAAGPGGGPHVKIFDAKTGSELYSFWAFETFFDKGVNVAVGDVDGNGIADIIVGADAGAGPRVSVFSYNGHSNQYDRGLDFFAYATGFTGGVRVSAGHFSSPIQMDIVTAPGNGGGPNIRVFQNGDLTANNFLPAVDLLAGNINDRGGLYVANGDFNGDGISDIVVGDGADGTGVRIYDGYDQHLVKTTTYSGGVVPGLITDTGSSQIGAPINPNFPGGLIPPGTGLNDLVNTSSGKKPVEIAGFQYGVRVAVQDVNRDKQADLILGGGPTELPKVRLINGKNLNEIRNFLAYDEAFFGGIYVGATGY